MNPDSSYTFIVDPKIVEKLPKGNAYLIIQHSMQNNQFDIVAGGELVRNLRLNNGTNLFRINGPGSLQGSDAAQALIAALNDPTVDDTYTEVPLVVDDTGITTPHEQLPATTMVPQQTQKSPLLYGPLGAIVLIWGIVVWSRR